MGSLDILYANQVLNVPRECLIYLQWVKSPRYIRVRLDSDLRKRSKLYRMMTRVVLCKTQSTRIVY
jgi:hypothetical protein